MIPNPVIPGMNNMSLGSARVTLILSTLTACVIKGRHDAYYTTRGGTQREFHGMVSPFSGI